MPAHWWSKGVVLMRGECSQRDGGAEVDGGSFRALLINQGSMVSDDDDDTDRPRITTDIKRREFVQKSVLLQRSDLKRLYKINSVFFLSMPS